MEIVIKLHEDDIMSCPEIIDTVKELAEKIAYSTPASWGAPLPEDFPCGSDEGFFPEPPDLDAAPAEWLADEMAQEADVEEEAPAEPEQPEPEQPEPEQPEPEQPEPEEPAEEVTVSIEEVRAAVSDVLKKHGTEKAKGILRKYGAEFMSELDKKYYAAALEDAKGAL